MRAVWFSALLAAFSCSLTVAAELPPVRIAYFVPSDRQPLRDHQQRLDRVMTEVQRFYREGMKAAGYGEKTFALERDDQNKLVVHLVQAARPTETYGRNGTADVAIFQYTLGLNDAIEAYRRRDRARAESLAQDIQKRFPRYWRRRLDLAAGGAMIQGIDLSVPEYPHP